MCRHRSEIQRAALLQMSSGAAFGLQDAAARPAAEKPYNSECCNGSEA